MKINPIRVNNDTMQANNKLKNNRKMDTTKNSGKNWKRNIAKIIGIALLLMAVIAAISAPITSGMFISGNASLTAFNVASGYSKFISSIVGWIGIFILDLLVSIGIYKYYKKEKPKLAKITSILRLIYSAFLGAAIIQLLKVTITNPAITLYNYLNMFNTIWGLGLIAFGFHLIALGVLFENEGGKKWINVAIRTLLIIAGLGYIILYVGMMIVPNPVSFTNMIKPIFLIPFIFGEVLYALWMLIKGGKLKNKKE
ncbi:DUF4386 domain-containing protein [Flavobacterium sp.]|uniref:DUF4386 domain-containing protein n=1 Tax=Flavobacterium sp. TaxID=239 RepID=UPI003BDA02C4